MLHVTDGNKMTLKLDIPENSPAYTFFANTSDTFKVVWTDEMEDSEKSSIYWHAGCHPEIVEYVWDTLGAVLAVNSCCTINGRPVLLHPKSSVLLAVCVGTHFVLRVIDDDINVAVAEDYKATSNWAAQTELCRTFGPGWFVGQFSETSEIFCLNSFDAYS